MDELAMRRCVARKRDGGDLSADQWRAVVAAFMAGAIDEAQMASLCMACVLRGMSFEEAHALTSAMAASGETLRFDSRAGPVVDKHSTGGVGDIVSLAAVPVAAACGARIAKLSGRALGHTGGTIDKLETIPGFRSALSTAEFERNVERIGCAIAAQTDALAPADKRLYALRDRTATIPALGLIASSIVSKKIAGGADAFVFDVKTGAAAFVRDLSGALELSRWLVQLSGRFGRRAIAFVTDMDQPLGRSIGKGLELLEARDLLRSGGDERATELILAIASALADEGGVGDAATRVRVALENGTAYGKFTEMIAAQGGDVAALEHMQPGEAVAVTCGAAGYVAAIDVVELGHAGRRLSERDPLAGLRVAVRIGDFVERGSPVAYVYGSDDETAVEVGGAFKISGEFTAPPPLIYDVMTARYPQ